MAFAVRPIGRERVVWIKLPLFISTLKVLYPLYASGACPVPLSWRGEKRKKGGKEKGKGKDRPICPGRGTCSPCSLPSLDHLLALLPRLRRGFRRFPPHPRAQREKERKRRSRILLLSISIRRGGSGTPFTSYWTSLLEPNWWTYVRRKRGEKEGEKAARTGRSTRCLPALRPRVSGLRFHTRKKGKERDAALCLQKKRKKSRWLKNGCLSLIHYLRFLSLFSFLLLPSRRERREERGGGKNKRKLIAPRLSLTQEAASSISSKKKGKKKRQAALLRPVARAISTA